MHMKKLYWFDKNLLEELEAQREAGGYTAAIGTTRQMRANNTLLYKTSMMQDGWDYFPLRLEINGVPVFRYVCENDFDRVCRDFVIYDLGAMIGGLDESLLITCPHIKRHKD